MKLKNKEQRSLWYKKIYYYLKSGQSLPESVKTAATDSSMMYIYEELVDGMRFSDVCSLPDVQCIFSKTEVSLIRVAEQTGSMQNVSCLLGDMLKEQHGQSQKLIAALIYPIMVLCMAIGLLLMILVVIVPKISPLFLSMKNIPMATKILITLSNHVINLWYVDLSVFVVFISVILYIKNHTKYTLYIEKTIRSICIHIPYLKEIYILWFIERWMQVVHLSLLSKVSILQSLGFGHESVSDTYLQHQFSKITKAVGDGNTCSEAISRVDDVLKHRLKDWISIIASGEKTGTLQEVFGVSHEHVTSNLKESFDRFQKIIEPMLIVLVGIMVLCICVSIILPMYQLTQSVQ